MNFTINYMNVKLKKDVHHILSVKESSNPIGICVVQASYKGYVL